MADQQPEQGGGFIISAQKFFLRLGIFYGICILALGIPFIQRYVMYQHMVRSPLWPDFDKPEAYGLAPGKTLNLYVKTADNETIGGWFILADQYYQTVQASQTPPPPLSLSTIQDAIRTNPTILYFHGTAGTRATASRIQHYIPFTSRLQANVFAIDYRGFGDSTGIPSELGLEEDAYTAWNWLIQEGGAKPSDVLIAGHSLGTGVATKLGKRLSEEGTKPRGIALLAPFSSLAVVIENYPLFGVPILQPLQSFPLGQKFMKRLILEKYDTLSIIQSLSVPVLLAHSTDDKKIPHDHSRTLIDNLLDPILPPSVSLPSAPGTPLTSEQFEAYKDALRKRSHARALLVSKREIPSFGIVEEFDGGNGRVVYVEAMYGSHNMVGAQEGVQNEIAKMFKLGYL